MGSGIKINNFHKIQNGPSADFQAKQEVKLRKASQMYEEHFLNEMLKQMRKTVPKSDLVKKSYAENLFQGQLDQKYVDAWTQKGGIGLADLVYNQMHEKMFGNNHLISKPQGPLPTSKSNMHPLHKKTPPKFLIQQNDQPVQPGRMNFNFKKSADTPAAQIPVQSPWSGEVAEVINLEDAFKIIKINHENGLKSTIGFKGSLSDLSPGQKLPAGQQFGQLSETATQLSWGVQKMA